MSTVAKRLEEAHEHLLNIYTSIPVLTPCLESIKTNQAEFVVLNGRLRQLQETVFAGQYKADKTRKQLDSVFTINKAECERQYRQEINELKAVEDERRICLRQRDNVVTLRYQLHKERIVLLEETRQLKKLTESVFDRSKDEVANADFPEELYWQLELKEYDFKITEVRRQVSKYNTALSNLARAANLSEAALMAFLGYPDAAYKVWRVEYALKASQKMRLYLRVELSLSNAYSNEDAAREACPNIVPPLSTPMKPSAVQAYFEPISKKRGVQVFNAERELRTYIAQLRAAHRMAETMVAQETERLNAMQAYRESIIPLLAKIRRHVFQNSCLGGYQIEGWEDEQGKSLLGTEADILVRGGIHEVGVPTLPTPLLVSSSSQSVPTLQRTGTENGTGSSSGNNNNLTEDASEEEMNTRTKDRRGNGRVVPDTDDQETSIDPSRPVVVHGGRIVMSTGTAPLSILAPANVLGSEVLMQVDRERQAWKEKKSKFRTRSGSRSGRDAETGAGISADPHQGQGSNGFSALGSLIMNSSNSSSTDGNNQGEREGRKRTTRGLFGFARSKRGSNNGSEDAVVPSLPTPSAAIFQSGRNARSSIDVTSSSTKGDSRAQAQRAGHHRNLPSISVSNHDEVSHVQEQPLQRQFNPIRRTFFDNASLVQLPSWSSSSSQPGATSMSMTTGISSSLDDSPSSSFSSSARPRVMSMDEYVGIGPVAEGGDHHLGGGPFDRSQGSEPLIPSYAEHEQHQVVDPEMLHMMNSSVTYEGLSSLTEQDENGSVASGEYFMMQGVVSQQSSGFGSGSGIGSGDRAGAGAETGSGLASHPSARVRSRSLSPHAFLAQNGGSSESHSHSENHDFVNNGRGTGDEPSVIRSGYQQHHYSLSDQSPDGSSFSRGMPPPDYAIMPPEYTA